MTAILDTHRAAEQALWRRFQVAPEEQFLSLGKPRLKVRVQQTGSGPAALFVPGVTVSGTAYAPLMARLPNLRCIALDRPGCGLSDAWTLEDEFRGQAVDVLDSVLDALGLESVVMVGNSLGALWSTWFALARPRRVQKLVLVGPSIGFPGVRVPFGMRLIAMPGLGSLIEKKMKPSPEAMRRVFAEMGHGKTLAADKIPAEMFDWGTALHRDTATQRNELAVMRRAVGVRGPRPWVQLTPAELEQLRVPTYAVCGTDDTHGGPLLGRRITERVPHSALEVLEDAGHVPWLDDAEGVARVIRKVCQEDALRAPTAEPGSLEGAASFG